MAKQLRPYQLEMKQKVYDAWNEGHKNVLLVLPTGGGKTVTFCVIAKEMAIDKKLPTAIQVHRKELVQQICLTLAEEGIPHNIIAPRPVILGIVAAERRVYGRQFYDYKAPITVISVDTLIARIHKHKDWARSIKFWITDEAAHVLKNNKWGKAISYFPQAIGLGVTATPQRLDKRGLGSHADGVFDIMVQGPNTKWMIDNGNLSKYRCVVPSSDYRNHLKEASEGHDYTRQAMTEASLKSHVYGDIVHNYQKFVDGKQAIVFADSIISGQRIEEEFKSKNIKAKLLTGVTEDKERLEALLSFREKQLNVLINVDLFDEGLDVPGIEAVIMGRPTKSLGKFLQMIGRGLRVAPNKPHAIIIDHVGNIREHGLPCARRKWTLDRIVKKKDKINLIRICKNYMCNAPFDRLLTECPYCGHKDEPRKPGDGGRDPLAVVDGDLMLLDPETIAELFNEAQLEDPVDVARRVARAAGPAAGQNAMKNQIARIETQKQLAELIAVFAGKLRASGYGDRSIHKYFYAKFDMTITQALGQTRAEMLNTFKELENEI